MTARIPDSVIAYLAKAAMNGIKDDPMYWDVAADQRERDSVFRAIRTGLVVVEEVGGYKLVPRAATAKMIFAAEVSQSVAYYGGSHAELSSPHVEGRIWQAAWDAAPSAKDE